MHDNSDDRTEVTEDARVSQGPYGPERLRPIGVPDSEPGAPLNDTMEPQVRWVPKREQERRARDAAQAAIVNNVGLAEYEYNPLTVDDD